MAKIHDTEGVIKVGQNTTQTSNPKVCSCSRKVIKKRGGHIWSPKQVGITSIADLGWSRMGIKVMGVIILKNGKLENEVMNTSADKQKLCTSIFHIRIIISTPTTPMLTYRFSSSTTRLYWRQMQKNNLEKNKFEKKRRFKFFHFLT